MKKPMTLQQVAARLADCNIPDVQRATGYSYNALKKIRDGGGAMYHTVVHLSNYFHGIDGTDQE